MRRAQAGYASISRSGGAGGSWGFTRGFTGTSGFDWNREAGVRYDNSIVFAAIMYAWNSLSEVDIIVKRPGSDGTLIEVPNHPITQLLQEPNPWYDGSTLLGGWIISELAGRGGMSYTYKHRSPAGKLIGLEYVPHFAIRPWCSPGSGAFIDSFKLSLQGGLLDVPPSEILQQRFGPVNPLFPQLSIGPLEAVLQRICTDKQADNYTASLLKNVGVTPHLISPSLKDSDGTEVLFGEAQAIQIENAWTDKITGDNRGRPLIMPLPVSVQNLSFNPDDMNLDAIHNINEERICAALGIHPLSLHLGSALEQSNNRASADAAYRQSARSFVKPYMLKKGRQLTRDLVPELGEPGDQVCFKWELMEALQDDKSEEATRDETACGGPWMTVNEIRAKRGQGPIEGGDVLRDKSKPSQDPKESNADINKV